MNIKAKIMKAGNKVKKHSPEILMVTGVIGVVASTVLACRATIKAKDILEDGKKNAELIAEVEKNPEQYSTDGNDYTADDAKADRRINVIQTGLQIAKVYAPAVILGALSLTAIISSNNILRKRNMALAAAYATLNKSFKEYRGRVKEKYGEEEEYRIHHDIHTVDVDTIDENGEIQSNKYDTKVSDLSDYAVYYTKETSAGYIADNEYNKRAIQATAESITYTLKAKGVLTLNEVYEALGMEPTKAGMVVGWIYDEKNPIGDNMVEIYIHEVYVDGELTLLLDFNVDGNIYDHM